MRRAAGRVLCVGSIAVGMATAPLAADPPEKPSDVGMVEHATTRLAQIDVTVAGPKGAIEGPDRGRFRSPDHGQDRAERHP